MTSYSKSQLFVSFSTEVAKVSLDTPAPRIASLPAPPHSVPLNCYPPSIIFKNSQPNTNVAAGQKRFTQAHGHLGGSPTSMLCDC